MTDNEIIKALEEWIKELKDDYNRLQLLDAPMDCFEESHIDNIRVLSNTLDFINRQKAENESLKTNLNIELENFATEYDNKIKAEAYKECIEKVKKQTDCLWVGGYRFTATDLDNLLNELVGEENEQSNT